jgi:hypothetical protein
MGFRTRRPVKSAGLDADAPPRSGKQHPELAGADLESERCVQVSGCVRRSERDAADAALAKRLQRFRDQSPGQSVPASDGR